MFGARAFGCGSQLHATSATVTGAASSARFLSVDMTFASASVVVACDLTEGKRGATIRRAQLLAGQCARKRGSGAAPRARLNLVPQATHIRTKERRPGIVPGRLLHASTTRDQRERFTASNALTRPAPTSKTA